MYTCLSFVALHLQGESLLHCVERAHVLQHLPHDGELRVEERVDPLTLAVTHGVVAIDRHCGQKSHRRVSTWDLRLSNSMLAETTLAGAATGGGCHWSGMHDSASGHRGMLQRDLGPCARTDPHADSDLASRTDRSAAVYHILTTRITLASDPSCRVDRFEDGPHSRVGLCAFLVGIDPTRWEGWTK